MLPTLRRKNREEKRREMPTWRKIDAAPADIITYIYMHVLYTHKCARASEIVM